MNGLSGVNAARNTWPLGGANVDHPAREVAIKMRMNTENTIRGLLASFGIRLPKYLQTYEQRVRKVLEGLTVLAGVIEPLLKLRTEARRQGAVLTKEMTRHARSDEACRGLMTIPSVGAVSAITCAAASAI